MKTIEFFCRPTQTYIFLLQKLSTPNLELSNLECGLSATVALTLVLIGAVTHTMVNATSHGKLSRDASHLGFSTVPG